MTDKQDSLDSLLQAVQSNQLSVTEAKTQLSHYDELGFAKIDLHRRQRQGFPEVVFGEGKTTSQIIDIISTLLAHDEIVLVTRVDYNKAQDI
ncbi:1-(5-phosphoribosyl)-5-amino-4-imidazole-carboxylate carboxylase, partial [Listeria monocytogenes]